ncbi:GM21352 [Drosophila sechellia]|uniref:GM21352 n=1 Tax=Drosophila sechellia TaxID=7238 RepID=B4HP78_DROSE|nr:GM21352 [Drosophila sechellia]
MSERGSGGAVTGGRHARVSPTPGRGSKIAYTPCPRSEPPQDLALAVPPPPRNCLAIPMSSLQTANGPGTKGYFPSREHEQQSLEACQTWVCGGQKDVDRSHLDNDNADK